MAALGEATVEIRATLGKLDGDLSTAKGKIQGALGGLQKGLQSVGNIALGAAVAGITAVAAGLGLAISEAMGAQQIMAQTEAVIKSTGGAAGMSAKQIGDLATALSTQSRFSDDAIQTGENLLLTFTNIGKDVFPQATQAMVDMAAAMGTDVSGGAIQLGKALNDPVAGISALTRVGVTFTDEQKKVIKALVATGDVAGAQAVILAELNKEFGGSAAAAAETFAGKLDVVKNKLLNVAEGIGLQVLPMMAGLLDTFSAKALPIINSVAASFGTFFDRMSAGFPIGTALGALVAEIATTFGATSEQANNLAATVSGVVDWFGALATKVGEVVAAVMPYLTMAAEWLAANVELQDVLIALGIAIATVVVPAIGAVLGPIALAVAAFVLVGAAAVLLRHAWEENWGGIQEKTAAVVGWLTATISGALASIQAWWAANGDAILAKASATWEGIKAAVSAAITTISAIVVAVATGIQSFWAAHGEAILTIARAAWSTMQASISATIAIIAAVIKVVAGGIAAFWSAWGGTIMSVAATAWSTIQTIIGNAMTIIGAVIEAVSAAIKGDWSGFGAALRTIWDAAWQAILTMAVNSVKSIIAVVGNLITSVRSSFSGVDWGGVGRSMIDGIVAGLRNAAGFLLDAARNAARGAFDAAMAAIQGHSPSKLFMDTGASMMQGMALGITRNAGLAEAAMSGALLPVMGLVGADAGPTQNLTYSSTTTVNTNRDPMQVLRVSRHLDKLGAMA